MELHPEMKRALTEMDFVRRYEALSRRFCAERTPLEERLVWIDGEAVMEILRNLGYAPRFHAGEKFYKIEEKGDMTFGVHILLRDGGAEFVWVVRKDGELLLGSPWSTYSRKLMDPAYKIRRPVFGTYEDLEKILKTAFEMYEDFKRAAAGGADREHGGGEAP